ncbi:MAG: hypothetical protein ACOZQL_30755 [Myxococcota bacterium]
MTPTYTGAGLFRALFAPMLPVCALVLALAIVSRFPPVASALPPLADWLVPLLVGAALGVAGLVERTREKGTVGPLWMRLGRPLSATLALGLSYFTTVFAQELQLSLGPVDPTFPAAAPPATATLWFFVFTLGFTGVGMMSAPNLLVPLLRVMTAPVARLASPASFVAAAAVGALFAAALLTGAHTPLVEGWVKQGQGFFAANATAATLALVAIAVAPQFIPALGDADE